MTAWNIFFFLPCHAALHFVSKEYEETEIWKICLKRGKNPKFVLPQWISKGQKSLLVKGQSYSWILLLKNILERKPFLHETPIHFSGICVTSHSKLETCSLWDVPHQNTEVSWFPRIISEREKASASIRSFKEDTTLIIIMYIHYNLHPQPGYN